MRVLLVDDDAMTRRILGRLLVSTFGVELVEAENGVEGLAQLEAGPADLVVMDVDMPLMDGFGMLSAIRASPAHRTLPAVAVSAMKDRDEITRLIQLEISDYLVKPLDVAAVTKRLGRVIDQINASPRRQRTAALSGAKQTLLVIEPDPSFRQLFRALVEDNYDILEAPSGPKGLKLAVEHSPAVVCISEGLGLLSENQLAQHLRRLATPPSAIYLLHAESVELPAGLFDGQLRKSFVPDVLRQRWAEMAGVGNPAQLVRDAITELAPADLVTAAQQTLGVMTQQEATRLPEAELDAIPAEVMPAISLASADGAVEVKVAVYGRREHAERLAGISLGKPVAWDEGGKDAFAQLVETLGGRVRSCLDSRGLRLEPLPVADLELGQRPTTWAFRAGFATATGEQFVVGMSDPSEAQ